MAGTEIHAPINRRLASIDVMRALTMTLMLFVNDIPGLEGVPHWMFHAAHDEDMLGLADVVFPAFLFCVGMSVPLSIDSRLARGESEFGVLGHILSRTFALLVMGLFTMNLERGAGDIPHRWFSWLMVAGFFLVWVDLPRRWNCWLRGALQGAGTLLLAGMVVWADVHGSPFRFGWWGILGLIGWTYLVCSVAYLLGRRSRVGVVLMWLAGLALCLLSHSRLIPHEWFSHIVLLPMVPGGWTHHLLGLSGMMATACLPQAAAGRVAPLTRKGLARFLLLGLLMLALALLSHHFWIISKIQATPTWAFFCLALFFPLVALFYWLADERGRAGWFWLIAPAGTATLTCYLLPYAWYPLRGWLGFHLPWSWYHGLPGLLLSLGFALIVVQVVRLMTRIHFTIKI